MENFLTRPTFRRLNHLTTALGGYWRLQRVFKDLVKRGTLTSGGLIGE